MEKAKKLYESIIDIHTEIRNESENYLRRVLEKNGKTISFDSVEDYYNVSVCYDGGRHAEYGSNVYSFVKSVFLNEKDRICLETEDCLEYDIARITWNEVYDVAMFIYEHIDLS